MSYQEKFWVLLSKRLSGEASEAELQDLENLITEHPEWQYAIQNLGDLWNHKPTQDFTLEEDAYMLHLHRMSEMSIPFGDIIERIPVAEKKRVRMRWYWAAAAVFVVAGMFFFWKIGTDKESPVAAKEVNEITTRPGSKSKVLLPDGTTVLLNAGSRLTYNKDYGKELREVSLTGEGFFDVTRNKDVPFIIHTSDINIKVLGTVFNVKAYPEDKKTETSLIRGSIEVTIKNRPNDKIILSPSEKLVVENGDLEHGKEVAKEKVALKADVHQTELVPIISVNKLKYNPADSAVAETQWTVNKLVFRDQSFEEIAMNMERWYDVSIEIRDELLAREKLSGTFENETILQALEALKISIPFRYEQTGNKIIIHR
jgi:ferric-dicitrate binding protein FerR (iron transport regulator)